MALRRWKPFLGAFEHIDAAIESAAAPEREEFKRARNRIVEALCCATDDAVAEAICRLLDDAMAESLATLRMVRAERNRDLLASGELVRAVGALARGHDSGRVRGLARGLVREWRAAVEADLATARAAMAVLDRASSLTLTPCPEDMGAAAATTKKRPRLPKVAAAGVTKIAEPEPSPQKKAPLVVGRGCVQPSSPNVQASSAKALAAAPQRPKKTVTSSPPAARRPSVSGDMKKMEDTKRKLQERYQEAEDAKRRRTIKVLVVAPETMLRQHKTLPSRP
ncbi:hypothetical protein EJB05_54319, partial [Eragrostis curvula]